MLRFSADRPKYVEYTQKRKKLVEAFKADVFPTIQATAVKLAQEYRREQLQREIEESRANIKVAEAYPSSIAKRRAVLVARLDAATFVSDEQKLRDDELQVLREFRKAVLKQKLTLKLEIDGVKLPEELKK